MEYLDNIKTLIAIGLAKILLLIRYFARQRIQRQENEGGCVACFSKDVFIKNHQRHCRACGYVGSLGGGGSLEPEELKALDKDEY